jgi:hypothetical protein
VSRFLEISGFSLLKAVFEEKKSILQSAAFSVTTFCCGKQNRLESALASSASILKLFAARPTDRLQGWGDLQIC